MNKILITPLIAFSMLFTASQVKAEEMSNSELNVKPFVGFEVGRSSISLSDGLSSIVEDKFSSFSLLAGFKSKENVGETKLSAGLSAYYQKSNKEDKTISYLTTTTSFNSFGFDASIFIPVVEKLEVALSAGMGYYDFEVSSNSVVFGGSEDHLGFRLGGGIEYKIKENISLTGMVRFVDFSDYDYSVDYVESMTEAGVGVKFYF